MRLSEKAKQEQAEARVRLAPLVQRTARRPPELEMRIGFPQEVLNGKAGSEEVSKARRS